MKVSACDAVLTFPSSVPTCSGNWASIEVSTSLSPFDVSTLDPALLADAFGAGLLLPLSVLLLAVPCRVILKIIKDS